LAHEGGEVLIQQLSIRMNLPSITVMQFIAEYEDLRPADGSQHIGRNEKMDQFILRFVRPLVSLQYLVTDCLLWANGFGHLIGCEKQTDIVRRHGGSKAAKANVNKYIKRFQRSLGVGQTVGQRSLDGCQAMREARLRQLERNKE
ncbi:MAG: hypothetical protein KGJ13_11240, partial [Patescibacteria group bacterium]|nr:hypothetical protein [Patescibacteria group bacterium]